MGFVCGPRFAGERSVRQTHNVSGVGLYRTCTTLKLKANNICLNFKHMLIFFKAEQEMLWIVTNL